jgi:hypothetical protein
MPWERFIINKFNQTDLFRKFSSPKHNPALGISDKGSPVKNQFVLATHLVNIDQRNPSRFRLPANDAFPLVQLAQIKGRSIQGHNQIRPSSLGFGN